MHKLVNNNLQIEFTKYYLVQSDFDISKQVRTLSLSDLLSLSDMFQQKLLSSSVH